MSDNTVELARCAITHLHTELEDARRYRELALRIEGLRQQREELRRQRDAITECTETDSIGMRCECWRQNLDPPEWCERCVERQTIHDEMLKIAARVGGARVSLTRLAGRALRERRGS